MSDRPGIAPLSKEDLAKLNRGEDVRIGALAIVPPPEMRASAFLRGYEACRKQVLEAWWKPATLQVDFEDTVKALEPPEDRR